MPVTHDDDLDENRSAADPEHLGADGVTATPQVVAVVHEDGQRERNGGGAKHSVRPAGGTGREADRGGLRGVPLGGLRSH
jgi:hypothetical protein